MTIVEIYIIGLNRQEMMLPTCSVNLSKIIASIANKLKTTNLTTQDYWKTLKTFIKPSQTSTIPPLLNENVYISEDSEKANLLNNYFVEQTMIDDQSAT